MNIVTKATGDSLSATEFNQIPDEIENAITSTGLVPSENILDQLAQGLAQISADGRYFSTGGTANDILLSTISPRKDLNALTNGLEFIFKAISNNSSSTTINICNLGAKNVYKNGKICSGGEIIANTYYKAIYNSISDIFEITEYEIPKPVFISVTENGAVGDGITDDTLAIQNVIDNAPAFSTIFFDGLFIISDEITIDKPLILRGNGGKVMGNMTYQYIDQGIIQTTANKNIFTLKPSLSQILPNKYEWAFYPNNQFGLGNLIIKDLYLCGSGNSSTGGTAIGLIENTDQERWHLIQCLFENLHIEKCNLGFDLHSWTVWNNNFENVCIRNCQTGIMLGRDDGDVGASKLYFNDFWVYNCDIGIDCYTHTCTQLYTTNCNFAYNNIAIYLNSGMQFRDYCSSFEDNTTGVKVNVTGVSYNWLQFIGTNMGCATSGNYSIYLDNQTANPRISIPVLMLGCSGNNADYELSISPDVHVLQYAEGGTRNKVLCDYADFLWGLRVNKFNKISMYSTPRSASVFGTGTTETIFKTIKLANNQTFNLWASVKSALYNDTYEFVNVGVRNNTTSTNIYNVNGQEDWRDGIPYVSTPMFTYTNTSGSEEVLSFFAKGNNATSQYSAMLVYTIN